MIERRLQRLEAQREARAASSTLTALTVPHVLEFAMSPDFLGVQLFPRQATLLKLMFCAPHLLTRYDEQVLREWTSGFMVSPGNDGTAGFRGAYGVPSDVRERMRWCMEHKRAWFREVIFVGGRRGSKSLLGAVAAAYVIASLLALGDPGRHFGIVGRVRPSV